MEPHYPIRATARLTSLSIDTLRAWERRYQAVTPERSDRGRLYSRQDIAKLTLLRTLVEQGHAIGQIAPLSLPELERLLPPAAAARSDIARTPSEVVIRLAEWFNGYRDSEANVELNRLAVLTPARELVLNILLPLMHEVGERWHRGEMSIAQEHLVSASMRNLLGSLLRIHPPHAGAPRMLLATLSGDLHEFGILGAAMVAASSGWAPMNLGPNLPSAEIARSAKLTSAGVVVIGNSGQQTTAASMAELAGQLPPNTSFWLGGPVPDDIESVLPSSIILIKDMETFERRCLEEVQ